jgi:hypothetical protein
MFKRWCNIALANNDKRGASSQSPSAGAGPSSAAASKPSAINASPYKSFLRPRRPANDKLPNSIRQLSDDSSSKTADIPFKKSATSATSIRAFIRYFAIEILGNKYNISQPHDHLIILTEGAVFR